YNGSALIVTSTASFQANTNDTTKDVSVDPIHHQKAWNYYDIPKTRTKILWQEGNANDVEKKSNHLGYYHIKMPEQRMRRGVQRNRLAHHVVISNATMMSSFRMRAVKEIETMCKNSFSNSTRDMIMIAAPAY
ncbi:hypothetical protein C0989_006225, partial [Termitomyces sp. Mn162]